MYDLRYLPRNAAVRKINELVKRSRCVVVLWWIASSAQVLFAPSLARVHALIISHIKQEMPSFFGKGKKQQAICDNLLDHFKSVMRKNRLPPGRTSR